MSKHPLDKEHPSDDEAMTLTYIARELGLSSDKAAYVARRRHQKRVANGSDEEPFPEPVGKDRRGGLEYRLKDVRIWLQGHTRENNPRTRKLGKK